MASRTVAARIALNAQRLLAGPQAGSASLHVAPPSLTSASSALRLAPSFAPIYMRSGHHPFSSSARAAMAAEKGDKASSGEAPDPSVEAQASGAKAEQAPKGGATNDVTAELEKQIKEKDAQIKDLKDKLLYSAADLANAQRRAQEERAQGTDYGITRLARDLTSNLDVLHLALKSVPEQLRKVPADASGPEDPRKVAAELYSGVELTSKGMLDTLRHHGVTQFDPTGEKFDPQEHEALYQAPVPGKEPGTVLECSKTGYRIKGRILRAAQVGVVQESA